jgi:hypothetical protein
MKIIFKEAQHFSYDGFQVRKYQPATPYEPTHAHEALMFQQFLESGDAVLAEDFQPVEDKPKVSTPKSKKA